MYRVLIVPYNVRCMYLASKLKCTRGAENDLGRHVCTGPHPRATRGEKVGRRQGEGREKASDLYGKYGTAAIFSFSCASGTLCGDNTQ